VKKNINKTKQKTKFNGKKLKKMNPLAEEKKTLQDNFKKENKQT